MEQDYLMHHGIRGQKWGIMNGPPYPLNDNVKAIAYRGGLLKDGTQLNINKRDVAQARKIVNKNIKYLTTNELNEYRNRLMLEGNLGDLTGSNWAEKQGKKILDSLEKVATNAAVKTGSTFLSNASMLGIAKILENSGVKPSVVNYLTKFGDKDDEKWANDKKNKNLLEKWGIGNMEDAMDEWADEFKDDDD